jgi:hypothetical protein
MEMRGGVVCSANPAGVPRNIRHRMLIVGYGPWNRPKVQTAENVHDTKGAAARAVVATVTPTTPKLDLEPVPPGPKPAHPANPILP